MSGWHIVHKNATTTSVKWYATERGAKIGVRAANKNAGWRRVSQCWSNGVYMEWAEKDNQYDYAPYQVVSDYEYQQKWLQATFVKVKSLMDPTKTVEIHPSKVGTHMDHSQERYWSQ